MFQYPTLKSHSLGGGEGGNYISPFLGRLVPRPLVDCSELCLSTRLTQLYSKALCQYTSNAIPGLSSGTSGSAEGHVSCMV